MTFFPSGNHLDFAIAAVGDDAPDAPAMAPLFLFQKPGFYFEIVN
jgi:hypothetical protein